MLNARLLHPLVRQPQPLLRPVRVGVAAESRHRYRMLRTTTRSQPTEIHTSPNTNMVRRVNEEDVPRVSRIEWAEAASAHSLTSSSAPPVPDQTYDEAT